MFSHLTSSCYGLGAGSEHVLAEIAVDVEIDIKASGLQTLAFLANKV